MSSSPLRFRAFCHIQHFSQFISPSALQKREGAVWRVYDGLTARRSLLPPAAGALEQLDPVPARAATASPCPAPGAHSPTNTAINQRTNRETPAEQTASPDGRNAQQRLWAARTWEMQRRFWKGGEGPTGSRDGRSGHPQRPARAGRSCPLRTPPTGPRESRNQQSCLR